MLYNRTTVHQRLRLTKSGELLHECKCVLRRLESEAERRAGEAAAKQKLEERHRLRNLKVNDGTSCCSALLFDFAHPNAYVSRPFPEEMDAEEQRARGKRLHAIGTRV